MADGRPADIGADKADASGELRAQELELWDRVLERWNKHTGRQVKIAASVVSIVIVVVGFLGVRSLDTMVKDTVQSGVEAAAADVRTDIEQDTKRLSDQLGGRLATMIVEVAKLEKEAERARKLVTRMEKDAKDFRELDAEIRGRMEIMEKLMLDIRAKSVRVESELTTTIDMVESAMNDIERVNKIALAALADAPSEEESRPARKLPPPSELGQGVLDALGIRQVPTKLAKTDDKQRYLLTFSAFVEETTPTATARDLLDSIDKVTYTFSKRWFKPHVFQRTNRYDKFQFTMTVWGSTTVKAKAEFVQGAPPVCWSGHMNLRKTIEFNPEPCDELSGGAPE